jgi:hypothetical protein
VDGGAASEVVQSVPVPVESTGMLSAAKRVEAPSDAKDVKVEVDGDKKRGKKRRVIIAPVKCRRAEEHLKEPFYLQ